MALMAPPSDGSSTPGSSAEAIATWNVLRPSYCSARGQLRQMGSLHARWVCPRSDVRELPLCHGLADHLGRDSGGPFYPAARLARDTGVTQPYATPST